MEISTSMDIDPNDVVDHRTDAESQFNEYFVETDDLESLWSHSKCSSTFSFSQYGLDFGTREMGAKIRQLLLPMLTGSNCISLDFNGVNVVSNSFADECIAKLLLEMPLEELQSHTSFVNLNPTAERSILVALQRRYRMTKN